MRRAAIALVGLLVAACGSSTVATGDPSVTVAPSSTPSALASDSRTATPVRATATPRSSVEPTIAPSPEATPTTATADFVLTSRAFTEGEPIPSRYTCDGADDQLPLSWRGVPDGTVELALIQHDPDAGGWVHWVVVGIPASTTSVDGRLPDGARHGENDFGRVGYDGPCPPEGNHTYVTTLFALSQPLDLGEAPTARQVRRAVDGITIATAQLRGTYRRS